MEDRAGVLVVCVGGVRAFRMEDRAGVLVVCVCVCVCRGCVHTEGSRVSFGCCTVSLSVTSALVPQVLAMWSLPPPFTPAS